MVTDGRGVSEPRLLTTAEDGAHTWDTSADLLLPSRRPFSFLCLHSLALPTSRSLARLQGKSFHSAEARLQEEQTSSSSFMYVFFYFFILPIDFFRHCFNELRLQMLVRQPQRRDNEAGC